MRKDYFNSSICISWKYSGKVTFQSLCWKLLVLQSKNRDTDCRVTERGSSILPLMWCVTAELGFSGVHNFPPNEQICPERPRERLQAAPLQLVPPLLQAVSCIGSGIQVLWKRHRGGWKTLISADFFLFLSHFHCWSPLFVQPERETLPFILKRGTNKVFVLFPEVKVWLLNGGFQVCFSPRSHLCLHQWSHQITVELTGWLEIKREREVRKESLTHFSRETQSTPHRFSLSVCLFPPTT